MRRGRNSGGSASGPTCEAAAVGYLDVAERSWPVLNRLMGVHTWLYRNSGGRIGEHVPFVRAPMLLLDHVGARSGVHRTAALLYVPDGDNIAIIASKGGYPQHPAWYHNLRANPETSAQIGTERRPVRAREATPDGARADLGARGRALAPVRRIPGTNRAPDPDHGARAARELSERPPSTGGRTGGARG